VRLFSPIESAGCQNRGHGMGPGPLPQPGAVGPHPPLARRARSQALNGAQISHSTGKSVGRASSARGGAVPMPGAADWPFLTAMADLRHVVGTARERRISPPGPEPDSGLTPFPRSALCERILNADGAGVTGCLEDARSGMRATEGTRCVTPWLSGNCLFPLSHLEFCSCQCDSWPHGPDVAFVASVLR
jgi:hypothetical protein